MNLKYQVFDTILDSIFVIDSNHTVIYVNEAGGNLIQVSPRTLLRKAAKFETLFMFSQPISTLDDLNLITEPTAYQELNYLTQNEKVGTLQISFQPVNNPEKHWLIFIRDRLDHRPRAFRRARLGGDDYHRLACQPLPEGA